MSDMIKTKRLTKSYGKHNAVNHVDMLVSTGSIYGLIGENGAGKTTILRMIGNLTKPSSGEIYLQGGRKNTSSREYFHVGVLIEQPGIYLGMSAVQNLKIKCLVMGINDTGHIDELLKLVGLYEERKKAVRKYSLGMKQRLGIALALVGYPPLVILDEPINGLDPQGIAKFRELLTYLNTEKNITFLISSHILGELSKIATDYGIIHNGIIIKQMSQKQLLETCEMEGIDSKDFLEKYYFKLTGEQKK